MRVRIKRMTTLPNIICLSRFNRQFIKLNNIGILILIKYLRTIYERTLDFKKLMNIDTFRSYVN